MMVEEIDFAPVDAILKQADLPYLDERALRELVVAAFNEYVANDARYFKIISTEKAYVVDNPHIPYKMVIDFEFEVKEVPPYLAKKGIVVGDRGRGDWKTTSLNLSNSYGRDKFSDYYSSSFQWKNYVSLPDDDCKFFIYRGVSKQPNGGFQQLVLTPPANLREESINYIRQGKNAIMSQYGQPLPWYKNMPSGCSSYGQDCPYLMTCKLGTPPEYLVDPPVPSHLSFSSISAFWTCPERYRRDRLEGKKAEDDSEATRFGRVFHLCMDAIYQQLIEKENN